MLILSFHCGIRRKQPVSGFEEEELGGRRLVWGGSALFGRRIEPFLPQFHPIETQTRPLDGRALGAWQASRRSPPPQPAPATGKGEMTALRDSKLGQIAEGIHRHLSAQSIGDRDSRKLPSPTIGKQVRLWLRAVGGVHEPYQKEATTSYRLRTRSDRPKIR